MRKSIGFLLVFLLIVIVISNLFGSSIYKYEKFANMNQLPQNIQNDLQQLQNDIANALNQGSAYSPTTIPPQLFAPTTAPQLPSQIPVSTGFSGYSSPSTLSFSGSQPISSTIVSSQFPPQVPLQTPLQTPPQVPPRFPPLI